MAKIIKVHGLTNHGEYGLVAVTLNDGTEGEVWVGGEVEVYYHRGRIKVFVKRPTPVDKPIDKSSTVE